MAHRTIKRKKYPMRLDQRYNDQLVTKFICTMMVHGKKTLSTQIFYTALDIIKEKAEDTPLAIFKQAMEKVIPQVEVRSRRVGGSTYQVPVEVRPERKQALAMRWIVSAARSRKGKSMAEKLSVEIIDASNGVGLAYKKKEEVYRTAEANKAFTHYRW